MPGFWDVYCDVVNHAGIEGVFTILYLAAINHLKLRHIASDFLRVGRLGAGVMKQMDLARAAYQAVEIIGPHRFLVAHGRHAVVAAHIVADEGVGAELAR